MNQQLDQIKFYELLITFGLSVWGGLAGYINQVIAYRRKFSWPEFACRGFVGSFTGVCAYLLSDYFDLSGYIRGGIAGTGGWLGAETVALVRSYFNIKAVKQRDGG